MKKKKCTKAPGIVWIHGLFMSFCWILWSQGHHKQGHIWHLLLSTKWNQKWGKETNSAVLAFKKVSIPIPHLADAKKKVIVIAFKVLKTMGVFHPPFGTWKFWGLKIHFCLTSHPKGWQKPNAISHPIIEAIRRSLFLQLLVCLNLHHRFDLL